MTAWLIDTFVYTALLIALVLLLRRPVSRHFGPQVAYALWALPLLRLLLPPIVLPASMAPAGQAPVAEPLLLILSDPGEIATSAAAPAQVGIALTDLLLPLWLGGAALFLAWRARDYLRMRRELLADARPVGEAGNVRLVETPAVASPVAFGISDKVVALPPLFMAHHDISARDMAIAHELAHHRGYDLVANLAAQPLLALHWFNPLAWWGWRAMRRDQEAACDARVVAGRNGSERAAYAQVIAGFAAGPHLAMAAPMACPVLGEKSIIHRLRSLTMSDVSTSRRRLGIALVTGGALALPLTASISYAHPDAPEAPLAPAAPVAPDAPTAPAAPEAQPIEVIDPDAEIHRVIRIEHDADGDEQGAVQHRRIVIRHGGDHAIVHEGEALDEAELEAMFAELEHNMARLEHLDAEIAAAMAEAEVAMEQGHHALIVARGQMPQVEMTCDGEDMVSERELEDGRRLIMICQAAIHETAMRGLGKARRAIELDENLSEEQRQRILERLDRHIIRVEEEQVSHFRKPAAPAAINLRVRGVPRAVRAEIVPIRARMPAPVASEEDCPEEDSAAPLPVLSA